MGEHGFLFIAFIFLGAAVVVVPLIQRSGLGTVLGYLLAGVALGPFGLGVVTEPQEILHVAEFGVVLMLFLIGLELQPSTLWRLRQPIVFLGGSQVVLTAAVLTLAAWGLGLSWREAVVVGLALGLSSTAIALKLLTDRGQLGTQAGQSAFSVLLFQDMAVVPILALLPLLAPGGTGGAGGHGGDLFNGPYGGWLQTATIVGAGAGFVIAGRYLVRPLFRFVAATGAHEVFTAFSLFIVVGTALLMRMLDLSAALGTFFAGVVLAESEYRHAVETDIEPFKGLLLGLFFMSVGMSVDLAVVGEAPVAVAGLTAGLLTIKLAILFGLSQLFRHGLRRGVLLAGLLAQGGEFAFVLLQFATGEGIISRDLQGLLIVVVALSMAATPLLLLVHDRVVAPRLRARLRRQRSAAREPDGIAEPPNPVIIFGYGRFGQVVGRLLNACGISTTVLDNDPDHVEVLRKYGFRVFYGDASRTDLLRAAGADDAEVVVLALDDPERTVETARRVRHAFPHLRILARARNRSHCNELRRAGVDVFQREMFESAVRAGRDALTLLGWHPYAARLQARRFARHDTRALLDALASSEEGPPVPPKAHQARAELAALLEADRRESGDEERNAGWGS